jgi:N-acetylneuraminic acid mutarotase
MGIYGTKGTPDPANVPGGRVTSVSWIDASGNLWLFGGAGFDSNGQDSVLNDLWEVNPSTSQWTWISGSDTIDGKAVYGTLGVAAAGNVPGARERAVSWTDNNGNLWLFGGDGFDPSGSGSIGSLNDLWEFSSSSKQWTWVSGGSALDVKGVYGTMGVPSAGNVPGARVNAVSWADRSGNLWLFGGLGRDSAGMEYDLNDLWDFNPSTRQWTWESGNSTVNVPGGNLCAGGVYGTEGTAAASNVPGGRNAAASWIDSKGNLWLFGGLGCDVSGTAGALNDLWEFNTANKNWTWQSGSSSVGSPQGGTGGSSGTYGTQGTAATANTPGGRSGPRAWADSSGSLWLFGGAGHDSTGAWGQLNDLWRYTP